MDKILDPHTEMQVFLDLDNTDLLKISDDTAGETLFAKLRPSLSLIGKRIKKVKAIGIAYDTPSVAIHNQAKELFFLGYFYSAILVCRSAAEYLAYEIFYERVELDGKNDVIETVADNLDFRKIVNEFLFNEKKGYKIINKPTHILFNKLYSLGNTWVHPKKLKEKVNIEDEAFKSIEMLGELIASLRDVLKDYDISKGQLVKKATAGKQIRPIKLGSVR